MEIKPIRDYFLNRTPRVWGKGYWGFSPKDWGCVSFTEKGFRTSFIRDAEPGDLVMIYATNNSLAPKELRQRCLGFYEIELEERHTRDCLSSTRWKWKEENGHGDKWNNAVPALRAWHIEKSNNNYPAMVDTVPNSYNNSTYTLMSTTPVLLHPDDQASALSLLVQETEVYGQPFDGVSTAQSADQQSETQSPSRGVPPYSGPRGWVETPGPKHLYRLLLSCDPTTILDLPVNETIGKSIWKVGYSGTPENRCNHFNNHLPFSNSFRWSVEDVSPQYSTAKKAFDAERSLINQLAKQTKSLSREFFLASQEEIEAIWQKNLEKHPPS